MTRTALLLLLLPVAGSEEPDPQEAAEGTAEDDEPVIEESGAERLAIVSLPDPAEGAMLLDDATALLTAGRFDEALAIAIPAISDHPTHAASFRAIADLAMDQLHRAGTSSNVILQPERERAQRRIGFELGTTNGMRMDWKLDNRGVDSMGMRLSAGPMVNQWGTYFVGHLTYYLDFNLIGDLQLETPIGFLIYSGYPYGVIGASLQYDPPSPLHVNLGAGLFVSGFFPELSAAFLW